LVETSATDRQVAIESMWFRQSQAGRDSDVINRGAISDQQTVYTADGGGRLWALDKATGQAEWQSDVGLPLSAGLSVDETLIFSGSRDGVVLALNKLDGTVLWQVSLSSEILAAPVTKSGVVIARTVDGKIWALDADNGSQLWRHEESVVPPLSLRGESRPLIIEDDVAIMGTANGKLLALSLMDGRLLWETTVAVAEGRSELERIVDVDGDIAGDDELIFGGAFHGPLIAVSSVTGKKRWSRDIASYQALALSNNALYISDQTGVVIALEASTGAIAWKQNELQERELSAPIVVGRYIIVGDGTGMIYCLARDDGQIIGRYQLDDAAIRVALTQTDDTFIVVDKRGTMMALRINEPQ